MISSGLGLLSPASDGPCTMPAAIVFLFSRSFASVSPAYLLERWPWSLLILILTG